MRLIGLKDENFGDMGDFTGDVLIPLDFNTVVPLMERKPVESFSICANSFDELFALLKNETDGFTNINALILMRIKNDCATEKNAADYGNKIAGLFGEDGVVTWAAQSYNTFRFDFYIYESFEEEKESEWLNSKGHETITVNCDKCQKTFETVISTVIAEDKDILKRQTFFCEECSNV